MEQEIHLLRHSSAPLARHCLAGVAGGKVTVAGCQVVDSNAEPVVLRLGAAADLGSAVLGSNVRPGPASSSLFLGICNTYRTVNHHNKYHLVLAGHQANQQLLKMHASRLCLQIQNT